MTAAAIATMATVAAATTTRRLYLSLQSRTRSGAARSDFVIAGAGVEKDESESV
jgi:hypothetical protein